MNVAQGHLFGTIFEAILYGQSRTRPSITLISNRHLRPLTADAYLPQAYILRFS